MVKYLSLIVILLSPVLSQQQQRQVLVKPALVMRDAPDVKSKMIGKIPFGQRISLEDARGPEVSLMGISGSWVKVNHGGMSGWVFGPFVGEVDTQKWYDIVDGVAYERNPEACLQMPKKHFPRFFLAGCLQKPCNQTCGNLTLEANGTAYYVSSCDGTAQEDRGKWQRKGRSIVISYTQKDMSPEDACSYRGVTRECMAPIEKANQAKCGNKNGCSVKVVQELHMTADNQFTLAGEKICVYP